MFSIGDQVCAVVESKVVEISDPAKVGYEIGSLGTIKQILPYHEPCHPKFKGQKFAIVKFTKKTGWEVLTSEFAFDLRDLRRIQL